jgi:hypothetical protein
MKTTPNHLIAASFTAALVSCRPSATTALKDVRVRCIARPIERIPVRRLSDMGGEPFTGKVFWIRPCSTP